MTAALAITAILVGGCGGGGGGGPATTGSGPTTTGTGTLNTATSPVNTSTGPGGGSNVSMTVSPLVVAGSAMTRQVAPTASVFVSFSLTQVVQVDYVQGRYTSNGIASIVGNDGLLTIQFKDPTAIGAGTYKDTIQLIGCYDQSCSQQVSDSPQTVQVTYTVTDSTVQLSSLSPDSVIASSQLFSLTVTGANFTPQSILLWNGSAVQTFFVSATKLTAQIAPGDIATPGNVSVSITDPMTGVSNTVAFAVTDSPMQLSSLSPGSAVASGPVFLLTVNGAGFTPQSTVLWNGVATPTTFESTTQLIARIPATDVAGAGNVPISVSDPVNGRSSSLSFTIQPAVLTLESLSPASVTVGGPAFMLTVLGADFTNSSVVQWNGSARPTTFISSNELIGQISATDIGTLGNASVTVHDPSSAVGTSLPQTVGIVAVSKDAVALQINSGHTGAINFASVTLPASPAWSADVGGTPAYALIANGKVYVTVSLSDGSSSELAIDQATGATVWGPVAVSGAANAAYDSGRVFVTAYPVGSLPFVEALDSDSGVTLWSTPLIGTEAFSGVPTAANGLVFVDGVAIDEQTGAIMWQRGAISDAIDAVTPDGVYLAYQCYTLSLRPATGETIWSDTCSGNGTGDLGGVTVVGNQLAYAQTDSPSQTGGSIYDAESGAASGTYSADVPPVLTPTTGYFLQGGTWQYGTINGATLSGVRLSDNSILWTFTGDGQLVTSPIAVNQYVFIGSAAGNLYALDGTTGQTVWQASLGGAIPQGARFASGPTFSGLSAGDGLLIVPNGTKVTAYVLSTSP